MFVLMTAKRQSLLHANIIIPLNFDERSIKNYEVSCKVDTTFS